MSIALAAVLGALALPAAASAAPRKTSAVVRLGFEAGVRGAGCVAETLTRPARVRDPLSVEPARGAPVGPSAGVHVTATSADGRAVSWTVAPDALACEREAAASDWPWRVPRRAWAVTYRDRVYGIVAPRRGGIRSIAGFRLAGNRAPTLASARRALGDPSSVRPTPGAPDLACDARWARVGLTIKFTTFGGGSPCRNGLAQGASVDASHAGRWAALVAGRPGIVAGTDVAFLGARGLAEPDAYGRRTWTLAEVWSPYGDADYVPSVMARVARDGSIVGFDVWIGAAGD